MVRTANCPPDSRKAVRISVCVIGDQVTAELSRLAVSRQVKYDVDSNFAPFAAALNRADRSRHTYSETRYP